MPTLTLAQARAVVDHATEASIAAGRPLSVCVVDRLGHEVLGLRRDGASWFTLGVARDKARTAATFERTSDSLEDLRAQFPTLFPLIEGQLVFRPTTLAGGVPLKVHGETVGGVGVAGGLPELDASIAAAAASALQDATAAGT